MIARSSVIVAFLFAIISSLLFFFRTRKLLCFRQKATRLTPATTGTFHSAVAGTFESDTGGTFQSATAGTFHCATGGTFQTATGGTSIPSPSVIEIKIRINREGFNTTLANFRQLHNLGIRNKYLFIYNSCSWKTIESYFWDKPSNCVDFNQLCVGAEKYDHGNYDELPEAIIGLKRGDEFLLKKDYVITDNRDMKGYTSLIFDDTMGGAISCLQTFLGCLMEITGTKYTDSTEYAYKINRYEGIPLFEM